MPLAMPHEYFNGDNYQTLDVKALKYCKIILQIFVRAIRFAASKEFRKLNWMRNHLILHK